MVYIGYPAAARSDELADLLRGIRYPFIFDIGVNDEGKLVVVHFSDDPPPFFRKALYYPSPRLTTGINIAQSGDFGKRKTSEVYPRGEIDDNMALLVGWADYLRRFRDFGSLMDF
jgi:hypothetical protein